MTQVPWRFALVTGLLHQREISSGHKERVLTNSTPTAQDGVAGADQWRPKPDA